MQYDTRILSPYPLGAGFKIPRIELCSGSARGAHSVAPFMGVLQTRGNFVIILPHSYGKQI
jgi:hypothetical protein